MHPDIIAIKHILTRKNYKKFLEMYGADEKEARRWLAVYHKLGRDEENRAFEMFTGEEKPEALKSIDELIELNKKKIEKLERIKRGIFYRLVDKLAKEGKI
ncbi:MAG TPA: hypothetical protein ENF43_00100 [Thermoplasmatales archaeon]|nr:hypothetical protein [Thermoplasmatales archaeon]